MARPRIGFQLKPVLVYLPTDLPERIDAIVGKQKRSEFIREALQQAIEASAIKFDASEALASH